MSDVALLEHHVRGFIAYVTRVKFIDKRQVKNFAADMHRALAAPRPAGATGEEEKLVAFFRSEEGDALGRQGDHDNLSPAETAIRAMRELSPITQREATALLRLGVEREDVTLAVEFNGVDFSRAIAKLRLAALRRPAGTRENREEA